MAKTNVARSSEILAKGEMAVDAEYIRYYDEKANLWYIIYWDDTLKCYVTQLESGQRPMVGAEE